MENIVDWDELEEEMTERATNPNYKPPKINSKLLWKTILIFVLILAIGYFCNTVRYTGTGDPRSWIPPWSNQPTGWNWDYNTFLLLLLGSVPALVVVGLKIEAGQSRALQKRKLLDKVTNQISQVNEQLELKVMEVTMLKRMLDDACITYDANLKALEKSKIEKKKTEILYKKVDPPCQPQAQPQAKEPQAQPPN